jgi:hypothetical protein
LIDGGHPRSTQTTGPTSRGTTRIVPRRRLLGGLLGGTLSPVLGLGAQQAAAQSCTRSRDCPKGGVCARNLCVDKCRDPFTCKRERGGGGCQGTCFCSKKIGGGGVCVQSDGPDCATAAGCRSQDDCPAGEVCAIGCCDPTKFLCLSACLVV